MVYNIDETGSVRSHHDRRKNFFFEVYIPEAVFPMAFKALDFAVFWCHNGTQSERVAYAWGTGGAQCRRGLILNSDKKQELVL